MTYKDTAGNVRVTEQFTVNIVDNALLDAMNICALTAVPGLDEQLRTQDRAGQALQQRGQVERVEVGVLEHAPELGGHA